MGALAKIKLKVNQGASFYKRITWETGATVETATPVDLTGCTAVAQVRAYASAPDVLFEFSTTNGRITLGGAAGTITLEIDAADTADLDWSRAVYDLEVTFADGTVTRVASGPVEVSAEVTRDA